MSRTLKVLQITNRIPYPLNDGGNMATYNVTKYLNGFGHQVILASLNTKKHYQDPKQLSNIAKVYTVDIDTSLTPFGLFLGLFSKTPYNIKRFVSKEFDALLVDILRKEKPDIIQLEGIYLAIYIDSIKKVSSAPIVLRSHNIEHEIWERTAQNEVHLLKKWYLIYLSKQIEKFELEKMHLFDGIISITDRDRNFYKKNNYKGPLKTVAAGVDLEIIQPREPSSAALDLCFLGSMEWWPNVQGIEWFLQKIWPSVYAKFPMVSLHIAGKNMSEAMKQQKVDGVTFHGMVPNAADFLNQHPIMIVPLLSGGGMRLKIVEAMALQRCIISTSVGAEGIEAIPGKEIIIANTPEEFLLQIEKLISYELKAEEIGIQARQLIQEKYSWEKLVREIEKFYLELI